MDIGACFVFFPVFFFCSTEVQYQPWPKQREGSLALKTIPGMFFISVHGCACHLHNKASIPKACAWHSFSAGQIQRPPTLTDLHAFLPSNPRASIPFNTDTFLSSRFVVLVPSAARSCSRFSCLVFFLERLVSQYPGQLSFIFCFVSMPA